MNIESKSCQGMDTLGLIAFGGLLCSLASAVMALLIVIFRQGLELPFRLLAVSLSIMAAAAFSPFLLPERWRGMLSGREYWYFVFILSMLLSPLLVFVLGSGFFIIYPVLAILALCRAWPFFRKLGRNNLIFIFHGGPLLAIYLLLAIESRAYAHLYLPECAPLGLASLDTFFLTGIANMIQKFGVTATGVDGLVPLRYHVGSIYWLAALGKLGAKGPLFSYPFGVMLVLVPMLYLGLVLATLVLAGADRESAWKYGLDILVLMVLLDYVGANSHYVSESYTFSLILLLFSIPLLLGTAGSLDRGGSWEQLVLLLVLVFAMVAMKISVGLLFGIAVGYAWFRANGFSGRTFWGLAVLAVVGLVAFYFFNYQSRQNIGREFKAEQLSVYFFQYYRDLRLTAFVSFISPLVFLCSAASRHRLYRFKNLIDNIRRNHVFSAELVLLMTLMSTFPSLILSTSDGYYFQNIAQWFALPLVFAVMVPGREARRGWMSRELVLFLAVLLIFIICKGWVGPGWLEQTEPLTIDRQNSKLFLKDYFAQPRELYCGRALEGMTGKRLENNPGLEARRLIRALVRKDRRKTLVFVPPSNTRFWKISGRCDAVPFFVPSVLGMAMLKGLPPEGTCALIYYKHGYWAYGRDSHSSDASEEELCRRALSKNFKKVLVLNDLEDAANNQLLECE